MLAYVNAQYDRAAALVYLNSPAGHREVRRDLLEKTEQLFSIQRVLGELVMRVTLQEQPPAAVELLASIREGADLRRVATQFSHWFLVDRVPPPPSDFPGLREFLEATIRILAARRTTTEDLWPFTLRGIHIFAAVCPGGDVGSIPTLPPSGDSHADAWAERGGMLMKTLTYEPAQALASTIFWGLLDLPYLMLSSYRGVSNLTAAEQVEFNRILAAKLRSILKTV